METVFKIRCRIHGIVTTKNPEEHNIIWKRLFKPEIYPIDKNHNNYNLYENIMKTSPAFKKAIETFLQKRASEDELFAITLKKTNKSIEECLNYILQCAKKGGNQAYTDEEVYGWAVHYYDEDQIMNVKPVNAIVAISEDLKEVKQQKPDSKKSNKKKEDTNQMSMF